MPAAESSNPVIVLLPDGSIRLYHEPLLQVADVLRGFPCHSLASLNQPLTKNSAADPIAAATRPASAADSHSRQSAADVTPPPVAAAAATASSSGGSPAAGTSAGLLFPATSASRRLREPGVPAPLPREQFLQPGGTYALFRPAALARAASATFAESSVGRIADAAPTGGVPAAAAPPTSLPTQASAAPLISPRGLISASSRKLVRALTALPRPRLSRNSEVRAAADRRLSTFLAAYDGSTGGNGGGGGGGGDGGGGAAGGGGCCDGGSSSFSEGAGPWSLVDFLSPTGKPAEGKVKRGFEFPALRGKGRGEREGNEAAANAALAAAAFTSDWASQMAEFIGASSASSASSASVTISASSLFSASSGAARNQAFIAERQQRADLGVQDRCSAPTATEKENRASSVGRRGGSGSGGGASGAGGQGSGPWGGRRAFSGLLLPAVVSAGVAEEAVNGTGVNGTGDGRAATLTSAGASSAAIGGGSWHGGMTRSRSSTSVRESNSYGSEDWSGSGSGNGSGGGSGSGGGNSSSSSGSFNIFRSNSMRSTVTSNSNGGSSGSGSGSGSSGRLQSGSQRLAQFKSLRLQVARPSGAALMGEHGARLDTVGPRTTGSWSSGNGWVPSASERSGEKANVGARIGGAGGWQAGSFSTGSSGGGASGVGVTSRDRASGEVLSSSRPGGRGAREERDGFPRYAGERGGAGSGEGERAGEGATRGGASREGTRARDGMKDGMRDGMRYGRAAADGSGAVGQTSTLISPTSPGGGSRWVMDWFSPRVLSAPSTPLPLLPRPAVVTPPLTMLPRGSPTEAFKVPPLAPPVRVISTASSTTSSSMSLASPVAAAQVSPNSLQTAPDAVHDDMGPNQQGYSSFKDKRVPSALLVFP
ncbi:unnamed protein product [Closterium sp. Naga37s-1]|nr:unnamed protein product [Closterium sp. Naga37s-1]